MACGSMSAARRSSCRRRGNVLSGTTALAAVAILVTAEPAGGVDCGSGLTAAAHLEQIGAGVRRQGHAHQDQPIALMTAAAAAPRSSWPAMALATTSSPNSSRPSTACSPSRKLLEYLAVHHDPLVRGRSPVPPYFTASRNVRCPVGARKGKVMRNAQRAVSRSSSRSRSTASRSKARASGRSSFLIQTAPSVEWSVRPTPPSVCSSWWTSTRTLSRRCSSNSMKIALAQISPRLGDVEANLEMHIDNIGRAAAQGADVVCFPELSLTGYYLRDLTSTVAVRPHAGDRIFGRLLEASHEVDVVVGFVEETDRFLYYNSAAYLSAGQVLHLHRKVYLPTYAMFDEQRFMASGDTMRSFATPWGRFAMLICEDMWHLSLPYLAWLDGADYLIGLVASPGRGMHAASPRLFSAEAWQTLACCLAQMMTTYVVLVNRVGYEDGVNFGGGSLVVGPWGSPAVRAR